MSVKHLGHDSLIGHTMLTVGLSNSYYFQVKN